MKGLTRVRWRHITVNEGEGPVNFTLMWLQPWAWLFIYVFAFGRRWKLVLPRELKALL